MKFAIKYTHNPPIPFPGLNLRPAMTKFMGYFILFVSAILLIYSLNLLSSASHNYDDDINNHPFFTNHHNSLPDTTSLHPRPQTRPSRRPNNRQLRLEHIVFGIAGSAELWDHRKNYIKLWWKPKQMRGMVWFDSPVKTRPEENLPNVTVSEDTTRFPYNNRQGHRSAIRISRIVSETLRSASSSSEEEIRWFVMGDDDTVFATDNLVRVLSKYDHREYYYVGGVSESHIQNIYYSYSMAYGGGGFAISYPLAKALERMQDRCLQRYATLVASDDRMQACMAELGVPLTKELGFHQICLRNATGFIDPFALGHPRGKPHNKELSLIDEGISCRSNYVHRKVRFAERYVFSERYKLPEAVVSECVIRHL